MALEQAPRADHHRHVDHLALERERRPAGGLDEAEEAQLGITDEELEAEEAEDEADLVKTPPEDD